MRIESYVRQYIFNDAENDYGLYLSNDSYHLGGDVYYPGFKPCNTSPSDVDELLQMAEVEFNMWDKESLEYCYVIRGLRQLLLGKKSDWKITTIEPQPGRVRLYLQNRKIAKVDDLLNSLDIDEEIAPNKATSLCPILDDLGHRIVVDFTTRCKSYYYLKFSLKRKDIKKEVDLYEIYVYGEHTKITEYHRIDRSRRETNLRFGEERDEYGNFEYMIGEIEESI